MAASLNGLTRNALAADRKSTRLNSSHTVISYAVFCLKKNKDESGSLADEEAPQTIKEVRNSKRHRLTHLPSVTMYIYLTFVQATSLLQRHTCTHLQP